MKKLITLFLVIFSTYFLFAQVPQKMSYQAVIRNSSDALVTNKAVGMRISILQGTATGTAVYSELHNPTTNANGLATIEIGGGTSPSGNFANINWANGPFFIKTETDPANGTNYSIVGTSQLLSVPYALYAGNGIKSISDNGDTLYLANGKTFISGKSNTSNNLVLPTILTKAVTGITSNSATFGGTITNANGNQIMERGVVYSTAPNPTLNSEKIIIGSGIGTYDSSSALGVYYLHLLNPNTTYYVRAYAITENNISAYGNEVSFKTLFVGQSGPGGGVVFFDKGVTTDGWRYLEAAPNDQSTGISWGCAGISIPGLKNSVGSGETNTSLIVSGCNETSFAAKLCADLILGSQTDWFLPSIDELNLMYKNLHQKGMGNFDTSAYYWSSTEYSSNVAWYFFFDGGSANYGVNKFSTYYVRAVRAF